MPTLFKRSNGIYYILFREGGKAKWVSTGQRGKTLALEVLMNYGKNNSLSNTEQGKPLSTPPLTLAKFIHEFLSFASTNYSAKTSQMYEVTLKKLAAFVGDIFVTSITAKDIDVFKVSRLKWISPVSVNIELRTLRTAFYTAMRWKIISENPTKGVSMARVPDMQPSYLTETEFQKLLTVVADEWFNDLLILAVTTGMRRGELLNLTWNDVNLPECRKASLILSVDSQSQFW
ncbi:MAG: integrase family protein [Bacteroidetes bacterium]|nr:integrase family protein [Bacteroidota bacterium]